MPTIHTILSVDDDPFYQDLYRNIFESKGYRIITASDPAEGYKMALQEKPDLMLVDVMMPERGGFRDGYHLLEELRKLPSFAKTPIVMVSALGEEEDVAHGKELGATAYVAKQSMMPDQLLKLISDLLMGGQDSKLAV